MVTGILLALALAALLMLGANTVTCKWQQSLTAQETIASSAGDLTSSTVTHAGFNQTANTTGTTTPATNACAYFKVTLSGGAAAIDLTALVGTNGAAVDLTGKKVIGVQINAPAGNGAAITLAAAGSNGYTLFGPSGSFTFHPGDSLNVFFNGATPTVGGTAKALTLTGTGGTDLLEVGIVAG